MRRVLLVFAIVASAGLLTSPLRATATYTFTTFDYPDSQHTIAYGINNHEQIVGTYFGNPPEAKNHGFLLENGTFTRIDAPTGQATQALAINDAGMIVGAVGDMFASSQSGFVKDGSVFTMVQPGAFTLISGINNDGTLVGRYTASSPGGNQGHAFMATLTL